MTIREDLTTLTDDIQGLSCMLDIDLVEAMSQLDDLLGLDGNVTRSSVCPSTRLMDHNT